MCKAVTQHNYNYEFSIFYLGNKLYMSYHLKIVPLLLHTHSPIVEYLWNLSSGLVCAITTQAACAECECHAIRALNGGHSSISVGCTASIVPQAHSIFNIFLHNQDIKHVYKVQRI